MKSGETVGLRVVAIANGFLMHEEKYDEHFCSTTSQPLFYSTLEEVEAALVSRFRAALKLLTAEGKF